MGNQIFQDLKGLHLSGMAECWQSLQETRKHQEIALQDGLVMLIQAEHDQRAANKTARLIKNARFRYLSFSFLYTYNSCFSTLALAGRPLFLVIGLAFET